MLNFAYGSNMLPGRIRERAPSATRIGVARLRGYQLCWHKPGVTDNSGKCDIVPSAEDSCVYGVLYEIIDGEMPALDAAEGGYASAEVEVECCASLVWARAYFAQKRDTALLPYSWYKALVVAGARDAAIPQYYVDQLESVAATQDPDLVRHARNMAMITAHHRVK